MICTKCNEGLVVVDIKVQSAYSDYRESWPERIDVTYKCNVCQKVVDLPVSEYPKDTAGIRGFLQKKLNADNEPKNGDSRDLQYGWRDGYSKPDTVDGIHS